MGDEMWLLNKQQPDQRSQGGRCVVQSRICALTEKIREVWCKHEWLIGEFANDTNQKHCLSRARISLYPQQSTWREVRCVIAPIGECCVLPSAKDPFVRIVEQFILIVLDFLH